MNPVSIQQLWTLIAHEWSAIPDAVKPWGVWITRHPPLTDAAHHLSLQMTPPLQAWFLESAAQQPYERSSSEFIRFRLMHFERPWDVANCASRDPRFAARCYPLGLGAFAPYAGSQDVCLEVLWGGLWGSGRRLTLTPEGLIAQTQLLWIA